MTAITVVDFDPQPVVNAWRRLGRELVKAAGDVEPAYAMSGMLYRKTGSRGDWIMLSVPNGLVTSVFSAMNEPGIELPPSGPEEKLNAHISVIRPEELEAIGGADKITERGKHFQYRLGGLGVTEPKGWPEMSHCWMLRVHSPELQALRRSYGLSSLPKEGQFDFHISVAVRRKGVLGRNDRSKSDGTSSES